MHWGELVENRCQGLMAPPYQGTGASCGSFSYVAGLVETGQFKTVLLSGYEGVDHGTLRPALLPRQTTAQAANVARSGGKRRFKDQLPPNIWVSGQLLRLT